MLVTAIGAGAQVGSRDLLIAGTHRFGGSGADVATDLVVHANGDAYVAGVVGSHDFPGTSTAAATNGGVGQRFVARFDARTRAPIFVAIVGAPVGPDSLLATQFARDEAQGLAVDAAGNAYLVAYESNHAFPAAGGTFRATSGSKYIFRVSAAGMVTRHSVALDPAIARVAAIVLDAGGNFVLTGSAGAGLVTTAGAAFATASVASGCVAPYVTRLSANGQVVQLATYLGASGTGSTACGGQIVAGNFDPTGFALALGSAGQIVVTGQAEPGLRATPGAIDSASTQPTPYFVGGTMGTASHAFVAMLTDTGAIGFVARIGASTGRDRGTGVVVDPTGDIIVAGKTTSANFPSVGGFGVTPWALGDCAIATPEHGFLVRLSGDGTRLVYAGYVPAMGGQLDDCGGRAMGEFSPLRVTLDAANRPVVAGEASSSRRDVRPTATSLEPVSVGGGLLFAIDGGGSQVWHTTSIEGVGVRAIALDPWGQLVLLDRSAVLRRLSPYAMPVQVSVSAQPACAAVPAVVTAVAAAAYGVGAVDLSVDGIVRGTAPVVGDAAAFVVALAPGVRRLTATYRGGGAFDGYASSTVLLPVNQAGACE